MSVKMDVEVRLQNLTKKKLSVTEVLGRLLKKKVKPLRRRSSAVASVTHIILRRRRHCDHHMTLSDPFP